ncbi:alpha/beta fold hydrolase [Sphingobium sp.]|uniref:alpha/beta fold hydrolase n=1 Tax=Sphingobium sp. TaxID=1912891 RepID=UPI003BB5767A
MMVKLLRLIAILLAILLLAFLGWFGAAKAGWLGTDRAAMIARYAGPPSRFITVDGVPMHVRVEGQGYPVLMLHGSNQNLQQWDPLAERLRAHYQIIRVDWSPYGLSGPDPKGEYSNARAAQLVSGVLDALKIDKIAVISTSNGANVALQLNADQPNRISAMSFSILPLERPSQTRAINWKIKAALAFHEKWLPYYHPKFYYRWIFEDTSHPGWDVPEALPQMMYDMANMPGVIPPQKAYIASNTRLFKTTDVGAIAETVKAPTQLIWCELDTVISQGPEATTRRFINTRVDVVRYPDVGHWPMWEQPDRFARDVKGFLDRTVGQISPTVAADQAGR